ncbi:MAG: hypothetical protein K0S08_1398 [Gammaproteobacteria bacterium]|jgi:hypothetical protein|nr:hypothetical protein [Gammaproteobacteria bacterium]
MFFSRSHCSAHPQDNSDKGLKKSSDGFFTSFKKKLRYFVFLRQSDIDKLEQSTGELKEINDRTEAALQQVIENAPPERKEEYRRCLLGVVHQGGVKEADKPVATDSPRPNS